MPASRWTAAASRRIAARGSESASADAIPRRHHAREKLRPSRCTMKGSLRSVTSAGVNSVAGSRLPSPGRKPSSQRREFRRRQHAPHQFRFDQRRRQEIGARGLPRSRRVAVAAEPRARPFDAQRFQRRLADGARVIERERRGRTRCSDARPRATDGAAWAGSRDSAGQTPGRAARASSPSAAIRHRSPRRSSVASSSSHAQP